MELAYKGKNAIVTGASGGMGLEISKMLSENNIKVLIDAAQSFRCIIISSSRHQQQEW